jgi:hypothetical protein
VEHKGGIALRCCFCGFTLQHAALPRTAFIKNVLRLHGAFAIRVSEVLMAAKRTYSVRLDDEQRQQLEARAGGKLAVGNLIRCAIDDYLRQEEQRDYLSDVEARIAATINRLARQVEKDRAEQQLIAAMLDYLREWLAFTLPTPPDKAVAQALMEERNKIFLERLPLLFVSQSKAKVMAYMEASDRLAEPCPQCGTGSLKRKQGKKGLFWYCTNWNATPKCDATFPDDAGRPLMPNEEGTDA